MQLKYKFELKKIAAIRTSQGTIKIGEITEYLDFNGDVRVTIKLEKGLPRDFIDGITKDPSIISVIGLPVKMHDIELIEPPIIKID